jgi:Kef-type K+ transport system membrane component KefB
VILLIIIILVAAAITGSLGAVLEVAAGVAVGIVLAVIGLMVLGYWYARHKLRQVGRDIERRRHEGYGPSGSGDPRRIPRGELPPDDR